MSEQLVEPLESPAPAPTSSPTQSSAQAIAQASVQFDSREPIELSTPIAELDPEIAGFIDAELGRQRDGLEMIASENHTATAVMAAQGSVLTNKYAEGYPGRRYYGGCEHVDEIERIAISRIKMLFGAEYANVQPHSGAQANASVMHALIRPGDTVLGLDLAHGGHLTHGMKVNFSGRLYNIVAYGVSDDTHRVDMAHFAGLVAAGLHPSPVPHAHVVTSTTHKTLGGPRGGIILSNEADIAKKINSAVFPGQQGGPLEHVIAGKAVAFGLAATDNFVDKQHRTLAGSYELARRLGESDIVERGISILTGGTDVHLVLVDLRDSVLDGGQAEDLLAEVGITVNRNAVPNDPRPPMVTSGLRIGTPALASRGFGSAAFAEVADIIAETLKAGTNDGGAAGEVIAELGARVSALAAVHPLYPTITEIGAR